MKEIVSPALVAAASLCTAPAFAAEHPAETSGSAGRFRCSDVRRG